ncbi:HlyD family efflux transporter periplasmic adaptor subunit [Priestia filamentosa]|uniref:Transporter n=1 Tax=Priestia filamentosa TaxID=1402861 RepID=A0A1X7DI43_9BACI|nr:HlyD family efflux transporter periplasmic adaptor subunit [Priestia filamentosa]AKO93388.1 transporter [Priestia filamentosa]MDT3763572.1 HlyD family efflux transporter periplasmic adaptor subunit [Priestia filamentosa]OXS71931.1 transporter [Priestia filamentosa]RJS63311.1 HlyD family secretion protein [Priestia filamentosa]WCM14221.1 HlyD family efflux transporter periplasmic adaptor subunit [Priestia filamentosa]
MSRGRLVLINIIGIIVILALVGGGGYYYYQNANYIKTENAQVMGDVKSITAPQSGKLADWSVEEGEDVSKDNAVANVNTGEGSVDVTAPEDGKIVKKDVLNNEVVQQGQAVAEVVDMTQLYVTANIEEDKLKDIEKGDDVEVTVDGDEGTTIDGKVEEVGTATNSLFSLMPSTNTDGNYTKVTHTIPVKISISNYSENVLPGMNAQVKINKN